MLKEQNELRWYVVHTRSRHEKLVRDELMKKGIENYLPVFREWHDWKDRKQSVEQPVFSGYVFARLVCAEGARASVLRTRGVVRILGGANAPSPVPDDEIESVRRMLGMANCFQHPFLREGSRVRVRRGPLKNLEGLFVQTKNKGRLVVSVNLLSQSVATELDISDVEVVRPLRTQFHRKGASPDLACAV